MMDVNTMQREIGIIEDWAEKNKGLIPEEVHRALMKDLSSRQAWMERLNRMPKKEGL
jgi:hypothetical protein